MRVIIILSLLLVGCQQTALREFIETPQTEEETKELTTALFANRADACYHRWVDRGALDRLKEGNFTKTALRAVCQCALRWAEARHPWAVTGLAQGATTELLESVKTGINPPQNPPGCENITPWAIIIEAQVGRDDIERMLEPNPKYYSSNITEFDPPEQNKSRWDDFVHKQWVLDYRDDCTSIILDNNYPRGREQANKSCECIGWVMFDRIPNEDIIGKDIESWYLGSPPNNTPNHCGNALSDVADYLSQ